MGHGMATASQLKRVAPQRAELVRTASLHTFQHLYECYSA